MDELNDLMPISPDHNRERLDTLKELFPDLFTNEGKLNPDELKKLVSGDLVSETERYEFRWQGKSTSKRTAFTPSRAALVYDPARSVNPDKAGGNMIIEGENLETLKLLTCAYRERIKCIYIDPPYNTGKDFVYADNFAKDKKAYWEETGATEEGVKVDTNTDTSGRYHSDWLSMMHSRLLVARQLLRDVGVVLVSIDDNEFTNLKRLMDEVFGEENFVAAVVWEKGRKNDAKLFSSGHEYVVVYARDKSLLREQSVIWREPKPGAQEIWDKYLKLKEAHGNDFDAMEAGLREWYQSLPDSHPSKKLTRYRHIDKWGPWRDRDISWPGGGGPRYDVLHPDTKQPCKVPERGWGFANSEAMKRQIDLDLVVFRDDHTEPPFRKAHLKPISDELLEAEELDEMPEDDEQDENGNGVGMQVMPTYLYKQSQSASKLLRGLMGSKVFDNPKDHEVLARLIRYVTSNEDTPAIVLDFFAGSGSTGHAVLDLNKDGKNRYQFILVQLPEQVNAKKEAGKNALKLGLKKVSDITIERVKRVITATNGDGLPFADESGFKVYKLTKSSFPRVEFAPDPDKTPTENVELLKAYILEKETAFHIAFEKEKIFDEVLLKNGFMLDYSLIQQEQFTANAVYLVKDTYREALLCLDVPIDMATVDYFKEHKDQRFICLEQSLDTTRKWNLKHHLGDKFVAF